MKRVDLFSALCKQITGGGNARRGSGRGGRRGRSGGKGGHNRLDPDLAGEEADGDEQVVDEGVPGEEQPLVPEVDDLGDEALAEHEDDDRRENNLIPDFLHD